VYLRTSAGIDRLYHKVRSQIYITHIHSRNLQNAEDRIPNRNGEIGYAKAPRGIAADRCMYGMGRIRVENESYPGTGGVRLHCSEDNICIMNDAVYW
jgi:hypothetical protein